MASANVFRHMGTEDKGIPIVIDAFDELAKIDESGIHQLLANAARAKPPRVIISSRSSEWNNSATSNFAEYIGHAPLVVRLCEFDESEQQQIYENYTQKEDFHDFKREVARFDLASILPNPQFLKMFADAYIESNGKFTNKKTIFSQAIARLAREVNTQVKPITALSHGEKIELSSQIFAKILLSGSEGVGVSEATESRMYPLLGSLVSRASLASIVLATRLFKPSDNPDHHEPLHKIISEYCAAEYFIKRISAPSDPLSLDKLLPLVAPNSVVRNELRGLVGWMASLGDKLIQEMLIELDPYAVLANGDPSQLVDSSKALLLSKLKEVENEDPYFRRGDFWRKFSVSGFFTEGVVQEIKPLLLINGDGHLRDLLLELLASSQASRWLIPELEQLSFTKSEDKYTRMLAHKCLLELSSYAPRTSIDKLVDEASSASLRMVMDVYERIGFSNVTEAELETFFRRCFYLYHEKCDRTYGERYFIKGLIRELQLTTVESLLDSLSKDLFCTCLKDNYECKCRHGVSKLIGSLLDRYFELAVPPYNPKKVWSWVENLNFSNSNGNSNDFTSVKILQEDHALRQGIIEHVFSRLTDGEKIWQLRFDKFSGHYSHAGLCLRAEDLEFIADLAFDTDNVHLWSSFLPSHYYCRPKEQRGPDLLIRHMRFQANEKLEFMAVWASRNRYVRRAFPDHNRKHRRRMKRREKKQASVFLKNIGFVNENRELVESGRHWPCLLRFSDLVLNHPENIEKEFGDENLVRTALRNCLDFMKPNVPELRQLAELQCQSKSQATEDILFAACLEIMRFNGKLDEVPCQILIALRTNLNRHWDAVEDNEHTSLKSEVDRLIFPNVKSAEAFLRQYVEPQLSEPNCQYPEVGLLKYDDVFSPLKASLSIEWLHKFNSPVSYALDTLFELAVKFGDRKKLCTIINERCTKLILQSESVPELSPEDWKLNERQKFWFVRAFYFLNLEASAPYFELLKTDKHSILLFECLSGSLNRGENSYWPDLCAQKSEAILDTFIDEWPKVHLPSSWGTGSPVGETAYRFIKDTVWAISRDIPDRASPVLKRLLDNPRFKEFHQELKSILAEQRRTKALQEFEPPTPQNIVNFLDNGDVVTVEVLRQQVLQELSNYQREVLGGEFNTGSRFYTKDKEGKLNRLGELDSVNIVAEYLSHTLKQNGIIIDKEHETKNQNRIDITAAKVLDGQRRLLVIEAKGQWHKELYSAASTQLYERYSVHPDAEQQGIYLVFWFGPDELVANSKKHGITSGQDLKLSIESTLPCELEGKVDVFVLDVSCV
ncbi:NACHT domain-containing NTPase [Vibrio splendidus]